MASADSLLPLGYENFILSPDILTRWADPNSAIGSLDSRVGSVVKGNYLISSPNVDHLFRPPLGICRVRLRRKFNFGSHNPLFYPQPFEYQRGHLSLIKTPSTDSHHPFAAAWITPDPNHYENNHDGILGESYTLRNMFYDSLSSLALEVLNGIPKGSSSDMFILQNSREIRRLVDLLRLAAPLPTLLVRVAFLQRHILELDARNHWCSPDWKKHDTESQQHIKHDLLPVVGAFTERSSVADMLFHLGVPVWFVRPVSTNPDARIDSVAPLIDEDQFQLIRLPSGFEVDATDAEPFHPILFEGLANKPERFIAMSAYIRSLVDGTSNVFGSLSARSSTSTRKAASTLAPSYHFPLAGFKSMHNSHAMPYPKAKPKTKSGVNTFLPPASSLHPTAVPIWEKALSAHSNYNQSLERPPDVVSGFYVPPPRLLSSAGTTQAQALNFRGWLHIRPLIFSVMNTPAMKAVCLSTKCWRAMLDVAVGQSSGGSDNTKTGKRHREARELLETCYRNSKLKTWKSTTFALSFQPFNDQIVDCSDNPPPHQVGKEITWELCELNFRQDLKSLDSQVDRSSLPPEERKCLLDACWIGNTYEAPLSVANTGLAASSLHDRIPFLCALHCLMVTWEGDKPEELHLAFPRDKDSHNFDVVLERFEKAMASFYVTSFLAVFGRAASIPHFLL